MILVLLLAAVTPMENRQFEIARRHAPADVKAVVDRWEGCNHWGGEEPYDKERAREIDDALKALRCDRLARDTSSLRRRYKGHARVQRLIESTYALFGTQG